MKNQLHKSASANKPDHSDPAEKKIRFLPGRLGFSLLALLLLLTLYVVPASGGTSAQVVLDVELENPVLSADRKQKTYLKVGLEGFELQETQRAPVNLSVVLDRSGSMSGDKIARAREALRMVVGMLGENDIFSLVVYDTRVDVLIPATRITDKSDIYGVINDIRPGGSTALFGGVSKGIGEVRKFLDKNNVNRVILLSDGLANVGPSSPWDLARLGRSAAREGISVTTIGLGLGYNEDLMTSLAQSSDGNHAFVENSVDLARIFESELGDVMSVVAQDVEVHIHCAAGIRPLRVLDRDAEIKGQRVKLWLNQLYSKQEKYALLEVEVEPRMAGKKVKAADVEVEYRNMKLQKQEKLGQMAEVSFSADKEKVARNVNKEVVKVSTLAIANEKSRQAVVLRDKGDVAGAKAVMKSKASLLQSRGSEFGLMELEEAANEAVQDADAIESEDWNRTRKTLRKKEYKLKNQTSY